MTQSGGNPNEQKNQFNCFGRDERLNLCMILRDKEANPKVSFLLFITGIPDSFNFENKLHTKMIPYWQPAAGIVCGFTSSPTIFVPGVLIIEADMY